MRTVKSQSFNPLQYSSSTSTKNIDENSNESYEKFDDIVTKGGKKVFKVDIGHFDKLCEKFRNKCHTRIKHLKGKDREDFNLMVSYVHLLYGTSYYKHLHG